MIKYYSVFLLLFLFNSSFCIAANSHDVLLHSAADKINCLSDSLGNTEIKTDFVDYTKLVMTNTSFENRKKFNSELINNTILANLKKPLNTENENSWDAAFWAMELAMYKDEFIFRSLKNAFKDIGARSPKFQRSLLEAVYCLYPNEFRNEIGKFLKITDNPKLFVMCVNYLTRINPSEKNKYLTLMKEKFNSWKDNAILFMLQNKLTEKSIALPPLTDILSHQFEKDSPVIFSLQRKNRDYPGIAVIRQADGRFVRSTEGDIFHISHLARAVSNLPCYITNGNTPQGIFSIQGIDTSSNIFLGKTPNIQTVLPFEVSSEKFFHLTPQADTIWLNNYRNLLPEKWKDYAPVYEAYYTGLAGRSEIIMHGTTIDPEYYKGSAYYPNTPTLGCLSAKELWAETDGKCLISDQAQLVNAFYKAEGKPGYLVVVELDDRNAPVTLDEVITDLLKAEKQNQDL